MGAVPQWDCSHFACMKPCFYGFLLIAISRILVFSLTLAMNKNYRFNKQIIDFFAYL